MDVGELKWLERLDRFLWFGRVGAFRVPVADNPAVLTRLISPKQNFFPKEAEVRFMSRKGKHKQIGI